MEHRNLNLVEEALGLDQQQQEPGTWPLSGKVIVVEDCVETSGSFLLHQLIKRILSPPPPPSQLPSNVNYNSNNDSTVIFLAFAHPFSHYDRILRKLGCNLAVQRENGRFLFMDLLALKCPDGKEGKTSEDGFIALFGKLLKTICTVPENSKSQVTIMIDDLSLMEVVACGSSDRVLDFLHYCHALTSEYGCSVVVLNHEDIYSCTERPLFMLQVEYLADVLIKAEPLATGLAADVHGQLTILNKGICNQKVSLKNKISNFHFRIKENNVEYFYPGSRT